MLISTQLAAALVLLPAGASAQVGFSLEDVVRVAAANSPQVRAAQAQYRAALHQIEQAYAPQDPQLSVARAGTPNGLSDAQARSFGVSESFQFPGVSWLQGDEAHRTAEIARLSYLAAARDARAQAETAYYQTLLDSAAAQIAFENAESFSQILEVARVAYTANHAAQTDLISAQFAVSQASVSMRTSLAAEANDEANLNQVMGREPETPLRLSGEMELKPLDWTLETVKRRAQTSRQEVLEAALTEKNAGTAEKLAWMELLPSFNVSWAKNSYPPGSTSSIQPQGPYHDYSTSLSFNVPIFFWFHQKEDIRAASQLLDAARRNRDSVELQTLTTVVQLYRSTKLAHENALLYRDLLVPLATQDFKVALIAYQAKQIDFTTLAGSLHNLYASRVSYLTTANQFLAGRVALEQAMGGSASQ